MKRVMGGKINSRSQQPAFTIVELLIVIVVIGILAAITVVAYNGVQQRARASAVSSALSQAAKKLALHQADDGFYPSILSAAGVIDTNDVAYQYTQVGGGTGYCMTATATSVSYKKTEATAPSPGGCAGHGQGGVAAITNAMANPSAETNLTDWSASFGASGAGSLSRTTTSPRAGAYAGRATWSTAPTSVVSSGAWIAANANTPSAGGKIYTATVYIRASWTGGIFAINLVPYKAGFIYPGGEVYGQNETLTANSWTKLTATITAPADTEFITVRLRAAGGTLPVVNSTLDGDAFMLTQGNTQYNFADGNSTDWTWTGAVNNSPSMGPPL